MIQDFFVPVSEEIIASLGVEEDTVGAGVVKHTEQVGFPDVKEVQLAFFDVREGRGTLGNEETAIGADEVRKEFYKLYFGNWKVTIADLGSILPGESITDTYFAVKKSVDFLVKNNVLPIIIGGGMDLVYANYRGYDQLDQTVNLSVISPKFAFGTENDALSATSYLSSIVLEAPNNLFNYSNLGYQTYYNSQSEIALVDSLNFEAHRIGALQDVSVAEPVMRDADIVAVDINAIKGSEAPASANANPNGFTGEKVCAFARYAGISDKVTSFGVYEYNKLEDVNNRTAKLISQMVWYFVEGYSLRTNDYPYGVKDDYLKYMVPFEDEMITFYQSDKSLRWWMQVDIKVSERYNRHVLIPCSYDDYLNAIEQKLPERWLLTHSKLT